MFGVRVSAKKELITRGTERSHKPEIGFLLRLNQATTAATIATAARQAPIATTVIDDEGSLELDSGEDRPQDRQYPPFSTSPSLPSSNATLASSPNLTCTGVLWPGLCFPHTLVISLLIKWRHTVECIRWREGFLLALGDSREGESEASNPGPLTC